jgi:microcystin-dependent protein
LGAVGGAESHMLLVSQIPSITSNNASQSIVVNPAGSGSNNVPYTTGTITTDSYGGGANSSLVRIVGAALSNTASFSGSNSISVTSNNTGGNAHNNVQPTIICNYILRII